MYPEKCATCSEPLTEVCCDYQLLSRCEGVTSLDAYTLLGVTRLCCRSRLQNVFPKTIRDEIERKSLEDGETFEQKIDLLHSPKYAMRVEEIATDLARIEVERVRSRIGSLEEIEDRFSDKKKCEAYRLILSDENLVEKMKDWYLGREEQRLWTITEVMELLDL